MRLCVLERQLEVTHLLRAFGVEMEVDENEPRDRAREDRLRKLPLSLPLLTWLDGSPIERCARSSRVAVRAALRTTFMILRRPHL